MASKTKQELAVIVLQMVGELASGQTPLDADLQICLSAYDSIWAQLQTPEFLAPWGNDDDIPAEAVFPIAALVASEVSPIFAVDGVTAQLIEAKAINAKPQLRANLHTNWNPDDDDATTEMEAY